MRAMRRVRVSVDCILFIGFRAFQRVCVHLIQINTNSHTCSSAFSSSGCLLEGVPPSAPPDVPPRNPTMNRMHHNGRVTGNPAELGVDFEPSCLVRTPSGNVYIPSGNLSEYTSVFFCLMACAYYANYTSATALARSHKTVDVHPARVFRRRLLRRYD